MLHRFTTPITDIPLPERFTYPFCYTPHPLCILAAKEVQSYLTRQTAWKDELRQGKMFGVLIVQTEHGETGYLAAFSGILAGKNLHPFFVPPVYDLLQPQGFFKIEEENISSINRNIRQLENDKAYAALSAELARTIQSAEDIQDALKDLLGGTIKEMMEAEMDDHLGYEKSERSDSDDYRNGYKRKKVNSRYGSMEIEVPQDRKSTFEPRVVKKRQKDISDIDQKIISMYAKGMTTRQISETIEDIYGFETSEGFISDVTDKILPQIEDWQNRPLDEVYPILYIDAIHYSVRDNGVIRKPAAYVILGINAEGRKEVPAISIGENESSKYWLCVLNELKNRGVKDILIICADGLTGIKEAITAAFPKTEYQRCIVHQVRNTLKYVPDKDRKAFAADLKTIYQAADEKKALAALDRVTEKWSPKYPNP